MIPISHARFEEQLRPHMAVLAAYCQRLAGNGADGEDLYQITLEKAYRSFGEKSGMNRAYLFRIAKNAWIDRYRKRNVQEVPLWGEYAAHPAENDMKVREAFEVMAERLTVRQSVLLLMIDVFGFTAKETAARFGSTEGAVKEALKRARLRLARSVPEQDAAARSALNPTSSADGMSRERIELFIRAFRSGNVRQIFAAYSQLRHRGIDVAKVSVREEEICFEFRDPNGHLMRVCSNKSINR